METTNETTGNKKSLPIFSIVLAVGLAVLYFLHFTGDSDESHPAQISQSEPVVIPAAQSGSIAFVNSEEILLQYKLVSKLTGKLDREKQIRDTDFSKKQSEYEQEATYFQEQVQKQSISEQSAQEIYQQLMIKQEDLYSLQQQYGNELAEMEFEMNVVLLDSVKNYLERLNTKTKFDYILKYDATGSVFVAKDTFDITPQVIEGLNNEYDLKYNQK